MGRPGEGAGSRCIDEHTRDLRAAQVVRADAGAGGGVTPRTPGEGDGGLNGGNRSFSVTTGHNAEFARRRSSSGANAEGSPGP